MSRNYVGIDPGLKGALACVNEKGELMWMYDMPLDSSGYYNVPRIFEILHDHGEATVTIALENTKRWSKLAQGYGILYALATLAMSQPPMLVTPIAWQRHLGIEKADKKISLKMAISRWPEEEYYFRRYKDHDRAEASFVALYLRDKMGGK